MQLGRQVLVEHLERPVKLVPKRGYKADPLDLEVRQGAAVVNCRSSDCVRAFFMRHMQYDYWPYRHERRACAAVRRFHVATRMMLSIL